MPHRARRLVPLLMAALVALAPAACTTVDQRIGSIHDRTTPAPHSLLRFEFPGIDRRYAGASGVAIAPGVFITARHTLPESLFTPPGDDANTAMIMIRREAWPYFVQSSGPGAGDPATDWAVVRRAAPHATHLFDRAAPLDVSRPIVPGQTVYIAGYPRLISSDADAALPIVVKTVVRRVTPAPGPDAGETIETAPEVPLTGFMNDDDFYGMSGGAAFILDPAAGLPAVIGIASRSVRHRFLGYAYHVEFVIVRPPAGSLPPVAPAAPEE